ncbi:MAG: IS30 family transposase [Clostridia bacterium]|nr:IS30 family transposase [Clostridia bacterium]
MKKKGCKNITYNQRLQIEVLLRSNTPKKEIAKIMCLDLSTIYKEIKRGLYEHTVKQYYGYYGDYKLVTEKRYSAYIAEEKYRLNCTSRGAPLKIGNDYELVRYIESRVIDDGISLHAVCGEIKRKELPFKTRLSKTTLYRYVSVGIFPGIKLTERKHVYKKTKVAKSASRGQSIEVRPAEVSDRNTFGHWEMDCVCGPTKESLLVFSERLTRKEIIMRIDSQKSKNVVHALNVLERRYGAMFKQIFKTITVDNGVEFSDTSGIEKSSFGKNSKRTSVYYCHPYSSCERGTNERLNREIRRKIPKGTDISKLTDDFISYVEKWVNAYPREVLGFSTSQELFDEQLSLLCMA